MAESMIQQVARAANVSVATVSRAFQSPERVAKKTRERIHEVAERLNYMPNAQARVLRTAKSNLVIALIPDIVNPFFAEVIQGIEDVAQQNGYSVLLGDTRQRQENERRYGDLVSTRQADGMITFLPRLPPIRTAGRMPVVNACELIEDPTISSVAVDNHAAFRQATEYLLALGHRSIAFVGGMKASPHTSARWAGFKDAFTHAGLKTDLRLYSDGHYSNEAGRRAADIILSRDVPVTAFMCVSDQLAIGVLQALQARQIAVPTDISVVGFDDIGFSRYTNPPLTTIAQPRGEIGREAMLMLLEILQDGAVPTRKLFLPTELVIRGSTAPPKPR